MNERECRIGAANLVGEILERLGAVTALVPRGPVMDKADEAADRVAELAEMIHDWRPDG